MQAASQVQKRALTLAAEAFLLLQRGEAEAAHAKGKEIVSLAKTYEDQTPDFVVVCGLLACLDSLFLARKYLPGSIVGGTGDMVVLFDLLRTQKPGMA